jgi:SAM-dependent methyltransferase
MMSRSYGKNIAEILGREPVHPFPARMAPGIALDVLSDAKKPLRVLDPMAGSGTVLAVARSKGHHAIGVDIDPLAVLISRVWTTAMDPDEVRDKAAGVLARARAVFASLPTRDAYPQQADQDTRRFVAYWFDDYSRRQLASLATSIGRVRDGHVRDALWCAFSRLIITKQAGASLAMDLAHSRPHKVFERAPIKPFRKFLSAVERIVGNCIDSGSEGRGPAARTREGDARELPLSDGSVDLVLTSPPYLNAIDYLRCSKFSLVWMGHSVGELRQTRAECVGAEARDPAAQDDPDVRSILRELNLPSPVSDTMAAFLRRYIYDMKLAVREAARVLAPGGSAVYVVGENTIRGAFIRNSLIVSRVAELAGLSLQGRHVRVLPRNRRYLPPPVAKKSPLGLDARMGREVVLAFAKP